MALTITVTTKENVTRIIGATTGGAAGSAQATVFPAVTERARIKVIRLVAPFSAATDYIYLTTIGVAGTGTITTTGTALAGTSTLFTTQLVVGQAITISGQTRIIGSITSATVAAVTVAFSPDLTAQPYRIDPTVWSSVMTAHPFGDQTNLGDEFRNGLICNATTAATANDANISGIVWELFIYHGL